MNNIAVAWEDIISLINQISGHLTIIVLAFIAMIVALYWSRKFKEKKSSFIKKQSVIVFFVILIVMLNVIVLGPLENTIAPLMGETSELSEQNIDNSREVIEEVAGEGIILTQNEDNALPISPGNINVFGWASTNPVYGGTGSGTVDISTAVDAIQGLENAGFSVNEDLIEMYTNYRTDRPIISINDGQDWTLPEVPVEQYSEEIINEAREFSDTAVIFIGRIGGEGTDLPHDMGAVLDGSWNNPDTKYRKASYTNNSSEYVDFESGETFLELSETETRMVEMVTSNFENVIVVYNGANTFEFGWTEEYEEIKSVLIAPTPGVTGFNALGRILAGEINPSANTVDTWVYDLTETPYYNNIGHFSYNNIDDVVDAAEAEWEAADGIASFVKYVEGIYTGYRFYETAAEEGLINYEETVKYPFGYGLSYTTFEQSMDVMSESNGTINVEVTVNNTGDMAGKDTVQIYYNPPYTNGGIEKASANLIAFDKTEVLDPGESETLTLSFAVEDMASYDPEGNGSYVLEAGDYEVSLRRDSHNVIEEESYTVARDIIYDELNPRSTDQTAATNELQFAEGDVEYLSRENGFANYEEVIAAPANFEFNWDEYELMANGTYDPTEYNDSNVEMPNQGVDNGLEISELRGRDFEDPMWEDLLDQLTVEEMVEFIAYGGFGTIAIDSINLPAIKAADGPAGVNSRMTSEYGTGYAAEIMLAQTWNDELAYTYTDGIIRELNDFNIVGWYAPSMNLHRSAFNGRNFEYYSEDPVLSSKMGVSQVEASYDHDIIPHIKHFAFNEQETNRNAMLNTWISEQAGRELYLRPFEKSVKANDGSPIAMMSVFNYIGAEWGNPELLEDILRDEWGFQGYVLTDYFGNYGYMDADRAIRTGNDLMLGTSGNDAIMTDRSATSVIEMRESMKNVLYTLVNSRAFEAEVSTTVPGWIMTIYIVDIILFALLILLEVTIVKSHRKEIA